MVFVGRQRETSRVAAELAAGRNVVVAGKHGVGRSALVAHVAAVMGDGWRFVVLDFSRSPGQLCSDLIGRLRPAAAGKAARKTRPFVSARAMAVKLEPRGRRSHVIVLDEVAALTAQKAILLRRLVSTGRYRFVAIVESRMREAELFQLRAFLVPVRTVTLGNLPNAATREYFATVSGELGLGWTQAEIAGSARVSGGYPPLMTEIAAGAAQRNAGGRYDSSRWRVPAAPARPLQSGAAPRRSGER